MSYPDPSETGIRLTIGRSDDSLPALVQSPDPERLSLLDAPEIPKLTLSLGPPLPVFTRYDIDGPTHGHQILGTTILYVPNQKRPYNINMDTEKWPRGRP